MLKPLCGEDPGLYENLLSFADQRYPEFDLICGVQDPADAAIPIVKRLQSERPSVPISLVVDGRPHGRNLKVANLTNMLPAARHDWLVMVDSDMRAPPNFLASVAPPLADATTGLVTSLYRAFPADRRLWSRLGAQYINHGFLPQAVLGETLRPGEGCFGASIAISRPTLEAIGGFAAIIDTLADDNALGAGVRRLGKRVRVAGPFIDDWVSETSFMALFRHELRWALTIRGVAPWGYLGSAVTHPVPLAFLAALLGGFDPISLTVLAVALLGRFAMVRAIDRALGTGVTPWWLIPGRDFLSFGVFLASFCTRNVAWRDRRFHVDWRGQLTFEGDPQA